MISSEVKTLQPRYIEQPGWNFPNEQVVFQLKFFQLRQFPYGWRDCACELIIS